MPQRRTQIKDLRKSQKKHLHNLDIKTDLRKTIKHFLSSVNTKNKQEASDQLKIVYKKLDKAVKRRILPFNTASRRKSKFTKLIANLA